ncbi:MAG: CusA/CzcA family heavy metal efflux RND transporter [Bacteroidia bacterium]|nr:CusA/CzcA family heavy metal efflux RND transporter [Bacteroidia bacterium]
MKKIIEISILRRWLMLFIFIVIGLFGYYSWEQLSIEAYPDIADVTSQVVTQVPGLAAEEMEQQITIPIERALSGLPGLYVMRSKSTFGLSLITLVFKDGVEDYWARARIQERLNQLDLPYDAVPELDPLTSPVGEIYRYIIESNKYTLREITDLQHFVVIPRLKQVPGVVDVTNFGGITTQFQIEIDPNTLEEYNLSLGDVVEKIQKNNANAGGSVLVSGDISYVIRGIGLVKTLEDLGKIVVGVKNGVPIYLSDLGKLKYGNVERKGILGYSDNQRNYPQSIEGIVLLLKGENPSNVLNGIHEAVEELNTKLLPEGVKIHAFLDRTELVHSTLNTVSHTLIMGMSLVIVILILYIGNLKGALLISITIPFSLLIAFILMHTTNIPANLLSLGAIDFGIIVDGAIVMLETILKRRELNHSEHLQEKTIIEQCVEVAKPIFFSTIIIITAYLPLFAFERVERKLFTPMAFTVSYALIGALLVAIFLIPGLGFQIYKKPQKITEIKWLNILSEYYERRIQKLILQPKKVLYSLFFFFALAVLFFIIIGKDFLPQLDEGSIWLQVQLPPGISLKKSEEYSDTLRKITMQHKEVSYIMVQAGRNDDGTDPWTPSHFEVSIGLIPYKQWPKGKTKLDLINELAQEYAKVPGMMVSFSQPMIDGVQDKIAGAHSEMVIKIYGDNFEQNRKVATQMLKILSTVKGAVDIGIDQDPPLPQLQIITDRDKIAQYGLNISDVAELIEVGLGGKPISEIFIGNKYYDIICRYSENVRNTPDKIANLMLTSETGAKIPLSQVAQIKTTLGESVITREMNKRHLTVKFNVRGRDLGSVIDEAQDKINKQLNINKDEITIKWGGQFENKNRAFARLSLIIPLALAIMFVLLYGAFGQVKQVMLLMSLLPLAALGGLAALYVRGMTINVSSAVGFIALFGVAIQNGVIMISHFNQLRKQGYSVLQTALMGSKNRLRPVLMTSSVAVIGLLPASLSTDIGSDIQRPLATVIVYGLLFSTIITLFALPTMYYLIEKRNESKE